MNTITITGLMTPGPPEDRAIAYLEVEYNNNTYNWQIYIPNNANLQDFIDANSTKIYQDIAAKEIVWANLDPKTRVIETPDGPVEVAINKSEIVKPTVPDYYALRRSEYPSLGDQLDALWKGENSNEFVNMVAKIQSIKDKYPKI